MINLRRLSINDVISDAPEFFNSAFEVIETHINALEKVIDEKTKIINLTDQSVSVSNGSIVSNSIVCIGKTGSLISVNPGAGGELFSVDAKGQVTAKTFVATDEDTVSEFMDVEIRNLNVQKELKITGVLDLSGNVGITQNYSIMKVTTANIGSVASTPMKIDDKQIIYLDYSNGNQPLGGLGDVKFDISTLKDGQRFRFVMIAKNTTSDAHCRLYNGSVGDELYCFINSNKAGSYQTIPATSQPEFFPLEQEGKKTAWVDVQWTNIGDGIYRFVILDYKNMKNCEQ